MILTKNPDITIDRWYRPKCTVGELSCGDFRCVTLELPWIDNQQDISCIPEGDYPYYLRESPKNGLCLELKNVPCRKYIQVHAFNYTKQTEGCISAGRSLTYLDNDNVLDTSDSGKTLNKLLFHAGKSGIIRIKS